MPSFNDLKNRAVSAKNSTTQRVSGFKDRHSSISTKQLDLETRQAQNAARSSSEFRPTSNGRTKPPPPPPPRRRSSEAQSVASPPRPPPPAPIPETRVEHHGEYPQVNELEETIDWPNLTQSDKEMFFSLLDQFFTSYIQSGHGPKIITKTTATAPITPSRPPLPPRKSTSEALPDTKASYRPSVAAVKAAAATPPRDQARSAPPLSGNRPAPPPIASSTRPGAPTIPARPSSFSPTPPIPEPAPTTSSCLCCRDFSEADAHAALFPRHTITSIPALAASLASPFPSLTDRARAIFTWLHHNIAYDAENFLAGTVSAQTPEQTLRQGKAVCEGYAGLFATLAIHAGLECIKVGGHGKGFGYVSPAESGGGPLPRYDGNHAWNAVKLDNPDDGGSPWKLIDSCWGAGVLEGGGVFRKRFAPTWFTASNAEFGRRHFPPPSTPSQQYVPPHEVLSWESYITLPERPRLMGTFEEYGYAAPLLHPNTRVIQSGSQQFYLKALCEHLVEDQADWPTPLLIFPSRGDQRTMTALDLLPERDGGGWLAEKEVVRGESVQLAIVTSVIGDEAAAMGLGAAGFRTALGRKAMSFAILAEWEVE